MQNICSIYSKFTPKVRPSLGQDMHRLCPRYSNDMPKIWPRYALFYVMIQDLGVFGQAYDKWHTVSLGCILGQCDIVVDMAKSMTVWVNIWHVAYFGPVVYLGKSMTRGSLFGQSYDMLLTFTLLYSWTNLWHLTNYLAKENQVWCQYCSCLFPLWSCPHP